MTPLARDCRRYLRELFLNMSATILSTTRPSTVKTTLRVNELRMNTLNGKSGQTMAASVALSASATAIPAKVEVYGCAGAGCRSSVQRTMPASSLRPKLKPKALSRSSIGWLSYMTSPVKMRTPRSRE